MGSQEVIKIEDDFILIRFQNDENETFQVEKQISQGLIQFHFGIKGKAKFIFNQGNYTLDLKEEKALLFYNPQKELPLHLELAPNTWVISVIISIKKFQEADKTTSVIVDGTYHQTLNEDIIVNGVKHGVIQVFQSARFGTTELFLDSKLHTEVDEAIEDAETNAILTLNSDGDLVTVQSSEDGQIETIISKRLNKE